MSMIIGIDHGYYAIKTAHCSFPAGLTSYGEHEPYLQLIKTDTETGKAVKIANTAFALYRLDEKDRKTRISMIDPASGSASKKTDVFYTDADGLMKTPEKLPLGRYLIEELQGPEGYFNDPVYSVEFEIKSDRVWQVVGI